MVKFDVFKFFKRQEPTKKTPPFMKRKPFNPKTFDARTDQVFQIYRLIQQPPITSQALEKKGIVKIDAKLYQYAESMCNQMLDQIRGIPACERYFGKETLKEVHVEYHRDGEFLHIQNIELTDEMYQLTKEIALYLAKTLIPWTKKRDIFVCWKYENITFINRPDPNDPKWNLIEDDRLAWYSV